MSLLKDWVHAIFNRYPQIFRKLLLPTSMLSLVAVRSTAPTTCSRKQLNEGDFFVSSSPPLSSDNLFPFAAWSFGRICLSLWELCSQSTTSNRQLSLFLFFSSRTHHEHHQQQPQTMTLRGDCLRHWTSSVLFYGSLARWMDGRARQLWTH